MCDDGVFFFGMVKSRLSKNFNNFIVHINEQYCHCVCMCMWLREKENLNFSHLICVSL